MMVIASNKVVVVVFEKNEKIFIIYRERWLKQICERRYKGYEGHTRKQNKFNEARALRNEDLPHMITTANINSASSVCYFVLNDLK